MSFNDFAPIQFVRPGPSGLDWVARSITQLKEGDPLRPTTVVVPNFFAGRFIRRYLGRRGGAINVRTVLLGQLADEICRATAQGPIGPALTPVLEASAIRAALKQVPDLERVAQHRSLHEALLQFARELRRAEISPSALLSSEVGAITRAAVQTYEAFRTGTEAYDDLTRRRDRAAALLNTEPLARTMLREVGAVLLYLPTRLDPADVRLLACLARHTHVITGFADLADPSGVAETVIRRDAEALALAIGLQTLDSPSRPERLSLHSEVRVVRAVDPAQEVREIVRRIATDLEIESPISLHDTAIVYRQADPYAPMVREALDLAEIPWSGLEGRSLAESRPGRALMALLRLPERDYTRAAVLACIESVPPSLLRNSGLLPEASSWERLSRAANVVRGAHQWVERLTLLAEDVEARADLHVPTGAPSTDATLRRQSNEARRLAAAMAGFGQALEPPTEGGPWGRFTAWAVGLFERFLPVGAWPESEQSFAERVLTAIDSLAEADAIERTGPSLGLFLDTLQGSLEAQSRPVGGIGQGVLIGPVQALTGLAFRRVYVLGMVESAFPPPAPVDPIFPPGEVDPLGRRKRERSRERQAFLTALAAGDGGIVTLCAPDAWDGRPAFASPWLLEVASVRVGRRLHNRQFRQLAPVDNPWLRVVSSSVDGFANAPAPADLEDRRLADVEVWGRVHALNDHPLARAADLPLARALSLERLRRSDVFTVFDGNVSELSGQASRLSQQAGGGKPLSATVIETWAVCPFRFLLRHVLGVETTRLPEDAWSMSPADQGSLVHEILRGFMDELLIQGRPAADERYTRGDLDRLEHLADEMFAVASARGRAGHPLAWSGQKARIREHLRRFLENDERHRMSSGLAPLAVEQEFGTSAPASWPAVELRVNESDVSFRGAIDRIDIDTSRQRAFVFDYKTGRPGSYRGLDQDPVLAGRHIQLAVYAEAVRHALGTSLSVEGAYWFLAEEGESPMIRLTSTPDDARARLRDVVGHVTRGIDAGAFPQVPGIETYAGFSNCTTCAFDRICSASRAEDWERKQRDAACRSFLMLPGGGGLA